MFTDDEIIKLLEKAVNHRGYTHKELLLLLPGHNEATIDKMLKSLENYNIVITEFKLIKTYRLSKRIKRKD